VDPFWKTLSLLSGAHNGRFPGMVTIHAPERHAGGIRSCERDVVNEVNMNTLLTEEDVATQLHVSVASIRRWRLERRGPRFMKVGSLVRYKLEDLEAWLAALPTGGSSTNQRQVHIRE
jgi:excisionase family DNA binding protein